MIHTTAKINKLTQPVELEKKTKVQFEYVLNVLLRDVSFILVCRSAERTTK